MVRFTHDIGKPPGQMYVVGGRAREALLGRTDDTGDIDVMVELTTLRFLQSNNLPGSGTNRHGNLRIITADYKADVFSPETFFRGFTSFQEAIAYFDLDVSAIGVSLLDDTVLDPIGGRQALADRVVSLNVERWQSTPGGMEQAVLRARLGRFLARYPDFECRNPDLALTNLESLFASYPSVVEHHLHMSGTDAAQGLRIRLASGDLGLGRR